MDLQFKISDTRVKIRVAGIISTPRGYLFEKSSNGYIFLIGGKIRANETSLEAFRREVMEEIGMQVHDAQIVSVIENLYGKGEDRIHEISFIYESKEIFKGVIPERFAEVSIDNIEEFTIKPVQILDIINKSHRGFSHVVAKDSIS